MPDLTLPKKVRQLKKLLRQITSLQNREDDGDGPELNAEEQNKIKRKPQLEADLAAAESQLLEERAAAGEPEPTSFAEMMAPVAMADVPEELPSGGGPRGRLAELRAGLVDEPEEAAAAEAEAEPVNEAPPPPPAAEADADDPPAEATAAPAAAAPPAPAPAPAAPPAPAPAPAPAAPPPKIPSSLGAWSDGVFRVAREVDGHYDGVGGLWWEDNVLLTGGWDTCVKVSDLSRPEGAEVVRSWGGHTARVRAVSLMRDEGLVLSGGADCCVRLWSLSKGAAGKIYVYAPLHSLDHAGGTLVTGLHDATVKLWDIGGEKAIRKLGAHAEAAVGVQFLGDGARALSASMDGTACVWDARGDTRKPTITLRADGPLAAARAAAAAEHVVLTAEAAGTVAVWDARRPESPLHRVAAHDGSCAPRSLALSDDGALGLVCGGRRGGGGAPSGYLSVVDVDGGALKCTALPRCAPLLCVQLRGRRAVAGCADGRIFVYDALAGGLSRQPADVEATLERAKPPPPRAAPEATNGESGVRRRPAAAKAKEEEEYDENDSDDDDEPRGGGGPCSLAFFVALLVAVALACGGLAMLNVRQAHGQWPFDAATPEESVEI
jgi:hypothetical protein